MSSNIIKSYLLKYRCNLCGQCLDIDYETKDYASLNINTNTVQLKPCYISKHIIYEKSTQHIIIYKSNFHSDKIFKKSKLIEKTKALINSLHIRNNKSTKINIKEYLCKCSNCNSSYYIIHPENITKIYNLKNNFNYKY